MNRRAYCSGVSRISVTRTSPDGELQESGFDGPADLREAAATWSWPDGGATEIRSDVVDVADLVGALPVDLGDAEQDDTAWEDTELPLGDDGRVFAPVTVNGYRWALVDCRGGTAWLPLPFWEYPGLETVYELSTTTVGGAGWYQRNYQLPGMVVDLTLESHANARVDGDEQLCMYAGLTSPPEDDSDVPEPYDPEGDPLQTIELVAPALDGAASQALAERLVARCAAGGSVTVNDVTIETEEEDEKAEHHTS
jgi:hypothetical protein